MAKPISSNRHSLVKAIQKFFPSQFFAHLKVFKKTTLWTPQRIVFFGLLMMWDCEKTLGHRFAAVRDVLKSLFPKWKLGTEYQGWCDAQLTYIHAVQPALAKRLRGQMQQGAGKYWLREGRCAFAADGSRVECPHSAANKEGLGCAGKKKTGPQLFLTTLWHMGTGLPWDYRIGPGTASERHHLRDMLSDLPAQSLVVADAGFTGYDLLRAISQAGHSFLVRVGSNVHLLEELGYVEWQGPTTVYLWPEKHHAKQPPVVLRLLIIERGKEKMHLVTNVFDEKALTQEQAAIFYEMRWGVEIFYRSCKHTMDRRRMLSRTPETCKAELHWVVMSIWLLGAMSLSAIMKGGGDPLSWSVALARKHVRAAMRDALRGGKQRIDVSACLAGAVKDSYERTGSKKAHDWPHKKKEKPPGAPKIRLANSQEIKSAKRLLLKKAA
jgi:Transposase DDE domain